MKIALAGNPNCGKTTLFNALTGLKQYVGNWPGVTVEKKEGELKGHKDVIIQDLPGIYSLSPYSLEEVVTRRYLIEEKPDVILNIVDGTNLERNLYLSTQLAELGIPMVIAVNMMDLVKKAGDKIDFDYIGRALGCRVVGISAQKGKGCLDAAEHAIAQVKKAKKEAPHCFTGSVEHALAHIEESLQGKVPEEAIRWYAIKVFEGDGKITKTIGLDADTLSHIKEHIADCERELGDDAEAIITHQRYDYIQTLRDKAHTRPRLGDISLSDKIDKFVTNKILAFPILFLALAAMWFLAVEVGGIVTDWANDVFLPKVGELLVEALEKSNVHPTLVSIINDGAWGGVATVLGFVPIISVIFLALSLLEDCGYMARVAFIMDPIFRKFGLSGKSIIPIIIGKGCGVPAVMATRAVENEKDRRLLIMLATFIPCGAKTVIIAMFATMFFRDAWYVAPLMDVIGIAIIILGGIALKRTKYFASSTSAFVMELPAYHLPTIKNVVIHTWERVKGYIFKAGAVIFPACVLLWAMMHFDWSFNLLEDEEIGSSILASLGGAVAWFFAPLGFGTWQGAAASISAELAKEQAVATLGVVAGGEESIVALFGSMSPYPKLAALSFMLFNLFIPPCIVAVATTFREMGSKKWGWAAVGFQLGVGYTLSLLTYQLGKLFYYFDMNISSIIVLTLLVASVAYFIYRRVRKGGKCSCGCSGCSGESCCN